MNAFMNALKTVFTPSAHGQDRLRGHERGNNERGNVIWFILLAIALTAALTMTLTRSSDTGGQTGDIERARIIASDIMRYASGIEHAMDQMSMRGVGQSQFSFENSLVTGYDNTRCADTDAPCRVFGSGGGAQVYMTPRKEWLDAARSAQPLFGQWYFTGNVCVDGIGGGAAGCEADGNTRNESLVMYLPWIKEDACRQINATLGHGAVILNETGDGMPADYAKFQGTYNDGVILNQTGRASGCFSGGGAATVPPAGSYTFFHVLIAR